LYITHLEINNFKSFCGVTKIPFFEGFTVISGPNGSGKSNIIDGILFVLALAGSSSLRAEKLTDLINLNGGKNFADVSVVFSDGTTIRRRIKRAAHGYYSYYYLNDRVTTQSELLDHLSKFGIKPEGYNVVMQGDITRIMEMNDTERRKIIDEIAGVAEFETKKEQALSELEIVRERIEREEIILRELSSRLAELEQERERAVAYRKLQDEIAQLEGCKVAAKLNSKEHDHVMLEQVIAEQKQTLTQLQDQRQKKETELETKQHTLKEIENQINQKSGAEYLQLVSNLEEKKSSIKVAEQGIDRLKNEKEEANENLNKIYLDLKRAETRVKECTDLIRTLNIDRSNLAMELAAKRAEAERIEGEIATKGQEIEGSKDHLLSLMKEVDSQKETRVALVHNQDMLIEKSRLRSSDIERLEGLIRQNEQEIIEKRKLVKDYESQTHKQEKQKDALDRDLASIESRLFSSRASLERVRGEIKTLEQDIMRLEAQQQARGEAESRALDAVLGMEGSHGTIATLGKAPKEYATALDVAAGARLGYVVVQNDDVAAQAITYLKEQKLGRLTFLPLNKLRPVELSPLNEKGVIDYAVNLLEYDKKFAPAFRVVFGATIVVDSLERARKMMGRYRIVTLEGELLEKTGMMTGGYLKKTRGFGVVVTDEISHLRKTLTGLSTEAGDHEGIIRSLTDEVDKKREQRAGIIEEITRNKALFEESDKRIQVLTQERTQLESPLKVLNEEVKGGADQIAELEAKISSIGEEITGRTKEIEELKKKLDETAVPALIENVEKIQQEIAEIERRLRNKESDITDAQRERQYFIKRNEELEGERGHTLEKNKSIDGEITSLQNQISSNQAEIVAFEEKLKTFSAELEKLGSSRDKALEKVRASERAIVDVDASTERVRLQITALDEREKALLVEIEQLRSQIGSNIEVTLSIEEIEDRVRKAHEQLDEMGAVNMLAIEEYDRVSGRVMERSEKKETLSRERTTLIERIEKFEHMKYDAFMRAFREIDNNFREIFARLTSGSGKLVLNNEEDPFSGGLTFAVQPQDKKVHLLSSLSGGEKSIVTLSFIFAIQKFLPAPFYAMDEIDMFLDGSNVERIAGMIKELSGNAQSIIVSLRKPMIETANRILGVTLNSDKSTLVTGVKING